MFGDFFNNKTGNITFFIIVLLGVFFLLSWFIIVIQEKIEDTVYTNKERLRKAAVLFIGSTVNVGFAGFLYFAWLKPRLDNMPGVGISTSTYVEGYNNGVINESNFTDKTIVTTKNNDIENPDEISGKISEENFNDNEE